jgi:hypothetical protein
LTLCYKKMHQDLGLLILLHKDVAIKKRTPSSISDD